MKYDGLRHLACACVILALLPSVVFAQEPETPNWTFALEWSPDDSMIAVGTRSGLIQLLNPAGKPLTTLRAEGPGVGTLAWSPDGTLLASAGWASETTIWDVLTGNIVLTLPTPEDLATSPDAPVLSIGWSPDGSYLAGVGGGGLPPGIFVWDTQTWELAFTDRLPEAYSLAWSPNGSRLAVGAYLSVVIYEVATWQAVGQMETAKAEYITALDWNPDGTKLAAGRTLLPYSSLVEVWDTDTLESTGTFGLTTETILCVRWSPDGKALASAGRDGTIRVMDPNRGETTTLVQDDAKRFFAVAWDPNGDRLIYGDVDGVVKIVEVPQPTPPR